MDESELQLLYTWIDDIPLSRPKRNITRDFSDGVMVAELVHHLVPRLVDLHNYPPASSMKQKAANWKTLNRKVFQKLNLSVPENVVEGVISNKPGVVEVVLNNLRLKIEQYLLRKTEPEEELAASTGGWGQFESSPRKRGPKAGSKRKSPGRAANGPSGGPKGKLNNSRSDPPPHDHGEYDATLLERDQSILDYQETIEMLQVKVRKLEQLLKLKDRRIDDLSKKLRQNGLRP